jgi:hypothetical protein
MGDAHCFGIPPFRAKKWVMIRYILLVKRLVGYMVFGFSKKNGYLMIFENCTYGMTDEAMAYLLKELQHCLVHHSFVQWANDGGHTLIVEPEDLSFERFWTDYDFAKNKIQAERYWKRMSDDEKRYALHNVRAYAVYCKANAQWYNRKYPDGFLGSDKLYMDEWYKVTKLKGKRDERE